MFNLFKSAMTSSDGQIAHKPVRNSSRLMLGVLCFFCVLTLTGAALYYFPRQNGSSDQYVSSYTPPGPLFPRASDFAKLLEEDGEEKVVTILGDSTGNEVNEWVYLLAGKISDGYDRPVFIHNWSVASDSYSTSTRVGNSDNGLVHIWNGSVPGADARYVLEHIASLFPRPSDLIIFSLGHNYVTPQAAVQGQSNLLTTIRREWPDSRPAIAITLQNPRLDGSSANQAAKVSALRSTYSDRADVSIIDVWSVFVTAEEVAPLLREDGFNPSYAGQILWVDAVGRALGLGL